MNDRKAALHGLSPDFPEFGDFYFIKIPLTTTTGIHTLEVERGGEPRSTVFKKGKIMEAVMGKKPGVVWRNVERKRMECPKCGCLSKRHSTGTRTLKDLHFRLVKISYTKFYCPGCRKHFSHIPEGIDVEARPSSRYTVRLQKEAVYRVVRLGYTLEKTTLHIQREHGAWVPPTTLHDWVTSDLFRPDQLPSVEDGAAAMAGRKAGVIPDA